MSTLRFLGEEEMAALKFAIADSDGESIEDTKKHFITSGTNLMLYDTGEKSVCMAWVLGDEGSFINHYLHEEIHHVLHEVAGINACCAYDKVARFAEELPHEPHRPPVPRKRVRIRYFLPYGFPVRLSSDS